MSEVVTKLAEASMSEIVSKVAQAMADATKEYGPQAVDLAMMAYRVSAIQSVILWVLAVAIFITAWVVLPHKITKARAKITTDRWGTKENETEYVTLLFVLLVLSAIHIPIILATFSVANIIAVFGYPELLIATKALIAAGLM